MGRGAVVVDTTFEPNGGQRHFGYYPQKFFDKGNNEVTKYTVRNYLPKQEFIVVLLKTKYRSSTYSYHISFVIQPPRI